MRGGKSILLVCVIAVLHTVAAHGEYVYIAPILSVEEGEEGYELDERYQEALYQSLEEQKGALAMTAVKTPAQIKTVRSSYDALKVCKEEKIEYLLYGWIKKGEHTYEGELRIFDGDESFSDTKPGEYITGAALDAEVSVNLGNVAEFSFSSSIEVNTDGTTSTDSSASVGVVKTPVGSLFSAKVSSKNGDIETKDLSLNTEYGFGFDAMVVIGAKIETSF